MRTIARLALLAAMVLGGSASSTLADEPKGDLAKLQGSWTAKTGPNMDIPLTLAINGNACEMTWDEHKGEVIKVKGEFKIDEKASPKTLDIKFTSPNGEVDPTDTMAIYKLEGDTWTFCSGGAGNPRPTRFESAKTGFPKLIVLTRVKDPEDKPIKGDLGKLQGTWESTTGPNDEVVITMTVKVNAYTAKWDKGDGTKIELRGELRVNDKATPNKTIDFFNTKRDDGEDARDSLGIYEFEDDKVKFCVAGPGEERPTEFKRGDDGAPHLIVFTKKKD
jgi:uncharacterized protein (TIGR03067 family)